MITAIPNSESLRPLGWLAPLEVSPLRRCVRGPQPTLPIRGRAILTTLTTFTPRTPGDGFTGRKHHRSRRACQDCDLHNVDMNSDGRLDGGDIDPFFACLGGGACP